MNWWVDQLIRKIFLLQSVNNDFATVDLTCVHRAMHCCAEIPRVTLTTLAQEEKEHNISPAFVGRYSNALLTIQSSHWEL